MSRWTATRHRLIAVKVDALSIMYILNIKLYFDQSQKHVLR